MFQQFLAAHLHEQKLEFFIPLVGNEFIKQRKGNIKAITTSAKWFGVTYKEDKPSVQECINKLIAKKEYPVSLWQKSCYCKSLVLI